MGSGAAGEGVPEPGQHRGFPAPSPTSAVSYVPRSLGRLPGRRGSAQLLVWPLVGCVTLTRSLPSLGPEFALQRRVCRADPHRSGGKVQHPGLIQKLPQTCTRSWGAPLLLVLWEGEGKGEGTTL